MMNGCRECADNFGTCPNTGQLCEQPKKIYQSAQPTPSQNEQSNELWYSHIENGKHVFTENRTGADGEIKLSIPATPSQSVVDERAEFTKWWGESPIDYKIGMKQDEILSMYVWQSWQARAQLNTKPIEVRHEVANAEDMKIYKSIADGYTKPSQDALDAERWRYLRRHVRGTNDSAYEYWLDTEVENSMDDANLITSAINDAMKEGK